MEKNKMEKFDENLIRDKIYSIRGFQVILDRDLAELYGVKSRRLREQVKRNQKRFPDGFMFQLTKNEISLMVSQNAIPSLKWSNSTTLDCGESVVEYREIFR